MNSENLPAVGAPVEPTVMPALGYKHHAERVRNTGLHMEATAAFIEAQNAEIEYLYAALQRVRNRVGGSQRNKCEQCGHSFTGKPEAEAAGGKVPERRQVRGRLGSVPAGTLCYADNVSIALCTYFNDHPERR